MPFQVGPFSLSMWLMCHQDGNIPEHHLTASCACKAYPSGAGKLLRLLCAERLEKMDEKSKELKCLGLLVCACPYLHMIWMI